MGTGISVHLPRFKADGVCNMFGISLKGLYVINSGNRFSTSNLQLAHLYSEFHVVGFPFLDTTHPTHPTPPTPPPPNKSQSQNVVNKI